MRRTMVRMAMLLAASFLLSSVASGYYFYVHYNSNFAYTPIPEKFDVSSLRNKTIGLFISDAGPTVYASGDSFGAVISQIRSAAKVWNDVSSSDLRISFGGLSSAGTPQNSPGIDVVFDDDIPPGLLALGGPGTCVGPSSSVCTVNTSLAGTQFVAITRSTLHVPRDLTRFTGTDPSKPVGSWSEAFFSTMVHELGHTLGLQHTLTSGAMATAITRTTTKAKPLSSDDIAAISVLYPTGSFLAQSGTISGRVTLGGAGVNLASVVAIAVNGPAVSALTNPDGTYTIQGIPANQSYMVYAHPLPDPTSAETRPANIVPPKDSLGNEIPRGAVYFDTTFYPGTNNASQAQTMFVAPGDVKTGINFTVNRRSSQVLSSMTTYGYVGNQAVSPALVLSTGGDVKLLTYGTGLVSGSSLMPGLAVSVLGPSGVSVSNTPSYYSGAAYFKVAPLFGGNSGTRHLLFSANNDIYVLPSAILLTQSSAPAISSVTAGSDGSGNRIATVAGTGFDSTTRILFDGLAATISRQNADGSLVVVPPPGVAGYRAAVVALNGDGQSSVLLGNAPPLYYYDSGDASTFTVNPSSLAAGSESMVEINGSLNLVDGQTTLGFGSSDITVRRLWVLGPNRAVANVSVSASAPTTPTELTVTSGLQVANQAFGFQILPQNGNQVIMSPPVNAVTGGSGVPAGGTAVANVTNLPASSAGLSLTVADQKASILSAANGQITFQVPAGLPLGAAVVKLSLGTSDTVQPVVMNIDPQPPTITGAFLAPGVPVDAGHAAVRGSALLFSVTGLPDTSTISDPSSIHFNIGGIDHTAMSISVQSGLTMVQVAVNFAVPAGTANVTLTYNGSTSSAYSLLVR